MSRQHRSTSSPDCRVSSKPPTSSDRGAPADDRGAGHVGHRAVRHHRRLALTEVERRAHRLVARHQVVGCAPGRRCAGRPAPRSGRRSGRAEPPASPRRGTTSESRKATNSVLQAARPVLRAAAGPLLRRVPQHLDVAVRARRSRSAFDRRRRAVVDHDDAQAAQRAHQATHARKCCRAPELRPSRHGATDHRRAADGPPWRRAGCGPAGR